MNAVDPILLAALAGIDMILLIAFRRRQAARFQQARMRDALTLAVRQENGERPAKTISIDKGRLLA